MPPKKKSSKKESKAEKSLTKVQLYSEISSTSGLSKTQVNDMFLALMQIIESEIKAGRAITIPGIAKITPSIKAATSARTGRNPFTGENMIFKAKPARNIIKIKAVKGLKELV